ncbi:MAG: hypothetical protein WCF33_23110 [Pseudonocardiaceae bacterium]
MAFATGAVLECDECAGVQSQGHAAPSAPTTTREVRRAGDQPVDLGRIEFAFFRRENIENIENIERFAQLPLAGLHCVSEPRRDAHALLARSGPYCGGQS